MQYHFYDIYSPYNFLKKLGPARYLVKRLFPDIIPIKENHQNNSRKGIFVTGIHRSGTSWIGNILSLADNVIYWREPFNPSTVKNMRQHYLYLSSSMNDKFYKMFTDQLFSGRFVGSVFDYTKPKEWICKTRQRHLIKDPTAAFMLEWMTMNYNLDIVIVVRHPAGFVSSILKLNWDFNFNLILNQKHLMSNFLFPYKKIIETHNYDGMDAAKGAVLWSIIYYVLENMPNKNNYYWIKYEDICANPQAEFKQLFKAVNLEWDGRIEKHLQKSISSQVTFSNNITSGLRRDAAKMETIWKVRLPLKDIETIDRVVRFFDIDLYEDYAE